LGYFTHEFEDVIALHGVGKSRVITYKVLFLPPHFESKLPFQNYPRLRVDGEIADVPVRGAWMPVGDGRRYFIVSPEIKKVTGLDVGDSVEMRFRIDDQDYVEVPGALLAAIEADDGAMAAWDALTAGKKRMFTFYVSSAKTHPTEIKRIDEALDAIRQGLSLRDMQKRKRQRT
jgi:hypothetical protein